MKKLISLFIISALIIALCSCSEKSEKKSAVDKAAYKAYVSDCDKGVAASFCGMESSLEKSKKAREYFKLNSRKKDGFLITDYFDGICINRVLKPEKWDYAIPDKIEGKSVVKLGCYLDEKNEVQPFIKFKDEGAKHITVPDSVKYIDDKNLYSSYNRIYYNFSKSNPYYATDRDYVYLFAKGKGYYEPVFSSRSFTYYDVCRQSERKVSASVKKYTPDKPYKKLEGYSEYVSDCDTGTVTSFCGTKSVLGESKKARKYYKTNSREADGFLVTDYLDGICINKVLEPSRWDGRIPDKIEGKPVIKLGTYLDEEGYISQFVYDKDKEFNIWNVTIPKTVKYIEDYNLSDDRYFKLYFAVDKDNPYYATDAAGEEIFAIEDGYVQPVYIYIDDGEM